MLCFLCGASNPLTSLECVRCDKPVGLGVAVVPLTEALERPEFDVHVHAAQALACFPDKQISARGRDFLARDLERFRFPAAAATALGAVGDEEAKTTASMFAAEKLSRGNHDYPWDVTLIKTRHWPDRAVDLLLHGMDRTPGAVDLKIASVLAECPHPRVTSRMSGLSETPDDTLRTLAHSQLIRFGSPAQRQASTDFFRNALHVAEEDSSALDALAALKALGASDDGTARELAIAGLLRLCEIEYLAADASKVLCSIDDPQAGLALAQALLSWPYGQDPANQVYASSREMPKVAQEALCSVLAENAGSLGQNGFLNALNVWGGCGFTAVRSGLTGLLPKTSGDFYLEVRDALAQLGDPACVAELCQEALAPAEAGYPQGMEYLLRRASVRILGNCCDPDVALTAIPALATGVTEDNEDLAEAAAQAIGRIASLIRFPQVSI